MRPFSICRYIPSVIQAQIVRSLLVSIATCGYELYRMALTQVHPIKRVIEHVVINFLGCSSSYYRKAAYEESSITSLALWGSQTNNQSYHKSESSRNTIKVLWILHIRVPMRHMDDRNQELAEKTPTSSKQSQIRNLVFSVVAGMTTRISTTDRSFRSLLKRTPNVGCALSLWKQVLKSLLKVYGMHMMILIRVASD